MPLGPSTNKSGEEKEDECLLSGLTEGREGLCSSLSWNAYYPSTVDELSRTMNQREEMSSDISSGHEIEQDFTDSLLYSDEYLSSGGSFGGAGQQVLSQSLQAEKEVEQSSGGDDGFCFGVYETDGREDVVVWSPEQAVPDSMIPLPEGTDEWIHASYLDDRTTSEEGDSGGSFEWGSTIRTGSANGAEIYGSQGWQDGYSDGPSSSVSVWKRSIWEDIKTSQLTFQDQRQQQQHLCDDDEDESALDVQQEMDEDIFAAATMTTNGLLGNLRDNPPVDAPPFYCEPTLPCPQSDPTLSSDFVLPVTSTTTPLPPSLSPSSASHSTLPLQQQQRRHQPTGISSSAKPTTPIPSTTSRGTEFVSTTERPRDWVLEQLEGLASRFLYDLSLREPPVIELASRTRIDAVVYDQEVGFIRRRRVRTAEAEDGPPGGDGVGATGLLEDEGIGQIPREEVEEEVEEETMETASSGKRRKVAVGSESKGGMKNKKVSKSTKAILYDTFDVTTTTKSSKLPPPASMSSSPFTQRSVYGSSRTSRILRATELIHENVSKDTISSKRDMYYRDVMAFGRQTAVDEIVEDLACTFEVPRSSLNVVAGIRSVVFGSVRMLVRALGKERRVDTDGSGVEDSGVSEQLLWLQEEIANSPFSQTQTLSNNHRTKEHGGGEDEEEDDPLDSRFSQTSYNTLVPIPIRFSDIVEIEIHPRTRFVLVIEKEATLSNLISLGFCETHGPCILLTSKGFPDQVARQLLKALSEMVLDGVYLRRFPSPPAGLGNGSNNGESVIKSSAEVLNPYQTTFQPPPLEIPLVALMDCDPYGIEIYLTYRCGSIKSAYENANLAVPALKYLGQLPSDWYLFLDPRPIDALSDGEPQQGREQEGENDEDQETMEMRTRFKEMLIPLTAKDRTKLERLITTHPYICQHARWRDQIAKMLEADVKTEIQSIHQLDCSSAGSGAFVAVGRSEGGSGGGGNIWGVEEGGELASSSSSSSALVLYLQHKLLNPEGWL